VPKSKVAAASVIEQAKAAGKTMLAAKETARFENPLKGLKNLDIVAIGLCPPSTFEFKMSNSRVPCYGPSFQSERHLLSHLQTQISDRRYKSSASEMMLLSLEAPPV
jgi:hypothetical protein